VDAVDGELVDLSREVRQALRVLSYVLRSGQRVAQPRLRGSLSSLRESNFERPDGVVLGRHFLSSLLSAGALAADPGSLPASFAIYRALDATIAQNQRKTRRLRRPVLGTGSGKSLGEQVADTMKLAADDVQTLVVPAAATIPRGGSRGDTGRADRVLDPLPRRAGHVTRSHPGGRTARQPRG
jgi:hypothetical protein